MPVNQIDLNHDPECRLHKKSGKSAGKHDVLPCLGAKYEPELHPHGSLELAVLHFEKWLVADALKRAHGHVATAAALLGMSRQHLDWLLDNRLERFNLRLRQRRTRRQAPYPRERSILK